MSNATAIGVAYLSLVLALGLYGFRRVLRKLKAGNAKAPKYVGKRRYPKHEDAKAPEAVEFPEDFKDDDDWSDTLARIIEETKEDGDSLCSH